VTLVSGGSLEGEGDRDTGSPPRSSAGLPLRPQRIGDEPGKREALPGLGVPSAAGRFGHFGGRYVPESLVTACEELEAGLTAGLGDPGFLAAFHGLLSSYGGRPTPVTECTRLSERLGVRVLLKREDLLHTGSHKLNNVIGQALLAQSMGKRRLIAETGAGQHGVATATAAALFGLSCVVYMGEVDVERQELNVFRMTLLGAQVRPVGSGSRTLKDAINAAMRDWAASVETTHYCIGSVMGPHPYPYMVRQFQSVIGEEARTQCAQLLGGGLPDFVVACVGGGSNAAGTFAGFAGTSAHLVGVEAAGGAAIAAGEEGVVHGMRSLFLQDDSGQILPAHSLSAGLDYPGIGPEHAYLAESGQARYVTVGDAEVIPALQLLAETEGILAALEPAHALAWLMRAVPGEVPRGSTVLLTLSGRGDKDVAQVMELLR
jgi:tryptophan synthase beta chain